MTAVDLGLAPAVRRLGTWDGRTALVTGADAGLGAALARTLVARGADVTFAGADARAVGRAADAATGRGSATALTLDVTDPVAVADAVRAVRGRTGRLDYVIAAARAAAADDAGPDAGLTAALAVEVTGAGALAAAAWSSLGTAGHLVVVAHPDDGRPARAAARAAVTAWVRARQAGEGGPAITLLVAPQTPTAAQERAAATAALDAVAAGVDRWPGGLAVPAPADLVATAGRLGARAAALAGGAAARLRR